MKKILIFALMCVFCSADVVSDEQKFNNTYSNQVSELKASRFTKPKCDDSDVIAIIKELIYGNGGSAQIGAEIGLLVSQNKIPNMDTKKLMRGVKNILDNGGDIVTYEDLKSYDNSKLNEDGKAFFKLIEEAAKVFFKEKPYAVITINDSGEKIIYCKAQLFKSSIPVIYTAQYKDNGELYVEITDMDLN